MTRLALYIGRQMLPWFASSLFAAALLFVVTQLVRIAPILAGADASAAEIARDLGLLMVPIVGWALAPAFAVAAFAVGGRMSAEGELVALDAAGIRRARAAIGPAVAAILVAGASAWLWLSAAPWSCERLRAEATALAGRAIAGRISPGRFASPAPGLTIYADAVAGRRLEGVLVEDARDPGRTIQITAAGAELRAAGADRISLAFERGEAFAADASGEAAPVAIRFDALELGAPLEGGATATDAFLPPTLAAGTAALLGPPPPGIGVNAWRYALWRRVAAPIGFLALALASTWLAFAIPWRRRGVAVGCAAALFLAYHAAGRLAETLLDAGSLGPVAAALAPALAAFLLASILLLAGLRSSVVQKG